MYKHMKHHAMVQIEPERYNSRCEKILKMLCGVMLFMYNSTYILSLFILL